MDRVFDFDTKPTEGDTKGKSQKTKRTVDVDDHPYVIGAWYLIRTVTMIDTGRVIRVTQQEIVIDDAAWVADTGRFADALKAVSFNEVEPFPDGEVIINRSAVIDAVRIKKYPRSQK